MHVEKWEGLVALLACCGSEISTFAAVSRCLARLIIARQYLGYLLAREKSIHDSSSMYVLCASASAFVQNVLLAKRAGRALTLDDATMARKPRDLESRGCSVPSAARTLLQGLNRVVSWPSSSNYYVYGSLAKTVS